MSIPDKGVGENFDAAALVRQQEQGLAAGRRQVQQQPALPHVEPVSREQQRAEVDNLYAQLGGGNNDGPKVQLG